MVFNIAFIQFMIMSIINLSVGCISSQNKVENSAFLGLPAWSFLINVECNTFFLDITRLFICNYSEILVIVVYLHFLYMKFFHPGAKKNVYEILLFICYGLRVLLICMLAYGTSFLLLVTPLFLLCKR